MSGLKNLDSGFISSIVFSKLLTANLNATGSIGCASKMYSMWRVSISKFHNCKICYTAPRITMYVKARANTRNIVGYNMFRAFVHHVVCCCVLLRLVGSCWMRFETGQTSEPASANISIFCFHQSCDQN